MKAAKRLVVYLMGVSAPTVVVILVWLFTFMSFNLFEVLHSGPFVSFCIVIAIFWGVIVTSIPYSDIEDMVS